MYKDLRIFFVVVSIVALIFIVGFAYWSKNEALPVVQNQTQSISQPSPSESGVTADWKTYRNVKYGFEVKYPQEWKVEEESPSSTVRPNLIDSIYFSPQYISIHVYENDNHLSLSEWYSAVLEGKEYSSGPFRTGQTEKTIQQIIIKNREALEISSFVHGLRAIRTFLLVHDKVIGLEIMAGNSVVPGTDVELYHNFRGTFTTI